MKSRVRILVIEDDSSSLEIILDLLNAFGYIALAAEDGVRGLEVARDEKPDSILCDIRMPRLDGYGVVARLRSDAALREIPVIAVTAQAMVGDRERLIEAGFDGYISKPIEPQSFVAQVESLLGAGARRPRSPAPIRPDL